MAFLALTERSRLGQPKQNAAGQGESGLGEVIDFKGALRVVSAVGS